MPADPRQCRLNADRCLALAKRLRKPEAREVFTEWLRRGIDLPP